MKKIKARAVCEHRFQSEIALLRRGSCGRRDFGHIFKETMTLNVKTFAVKTI